MVSGAGDTTDFIPLDLTGDQVPLDPSPAGGAPATPEGVGGLLGGASVGQTAQDATALAVLGLLIPLIAEILKDVGVTGPSQWYGSFTKNLDKGVAAIAGDIGTTLYDWMIRISDNVFIAPLLQKGLGIDLPPDGSQASSSMKTIDSMIGFATSLEFGVSAIQAIGGFLLGNRWKESVGVTLGKIPEEMGLSWALGLIINRVFEAAFGEALNNYVRAKTMPNEPEWPIARQMLRQHVIQSDDLDRILANAGYTPDWRDKIKALETQPLPVGDIQAGYQQGVIQESDLDPLLIALGFSDANRDILKQVYITKAETAAGAEIRTVWRSLFRDSLVTEAEYRDKLASVNFPQLLIDGDVQAVKDEKSYGWKVQSIAVVKSAYLHNPGSQATAISKLQTLGYSQADATSMVNSWTAPPIRRQHGLTEAQILKYLIAGLISPDKARTDLLALAIDPNTVDFLLAHPTTAAGAHVVRLTPALVIQAYLVGAIQQSDLRDALAKAGATGDVQDYYYQQALYKYAHHHEAGSGQTPLSEGHILSAYKYQIFDQATALTHLEALGYSQANATVLLEIENKGLFQPPQPPAFSSVSAALAYLVSLGASIGEPVSSTFIAAEQMVEAAGYTVTFPPGFTPPTAPPVSGVPIGTPGTAP